MLSQSYGSRKTMKNVSKNKFLTCFRPVVDIDAMLESEAVVDRSASRRFTCDPVADKHPRKNSPTKSMFSGQEYSEMKQNQVVRQPPKQTFAKVIKAVVFETILNPRAHKKNRYGPNCFGSKRSYSAYTEGSSTGHEKSTVSLASSDTNIKEIKALELSWSGSSSGLAVSESKSLSKCKSTKGQLERQKMFQCLGINVVIISLVVTVLWGKINVIILTSILFCCFSLWNACSRRLKGVAIAKLSNTESKAHKNSHRDHKGRIG